MLCSRFCEWDYAHALQLFVPFREFLTTSVRLITPVYFSKQMNVMRKEIHAKELSRIAKESIIDCTEMVRYGISENVKKLPNQELVTLPGYLHMHTSHARVSIYICLYSYSFYVSS